MRQLTLFERRPQPRASRHGLHLVGDRWVSSPELRRLEEAAAQAHPIVLGCVKTKRGSRLPARELYASPLWNKRRAFAEQSGRPWLILSAKHGLLEPGTKVDPYDVTIPGLSKAARRELVELVRRQSSSLLRPDAVLEVHAGAPYVSVLRDAGLRTEHPMRGKQIGQQLAWYKRRL